MLCSTLFLALRHNQNQGTEGAEGAGGEANSSMTCSFNWECGQVDIERLKTENLKLRNLALIDVCLHCCA